MAKNEILTRLVDLAPGLADLYRSIKDQRNRNAEPQVTPWGFKLAGHEDMAAGDFEPKETALVRDLLQDMDIFVNVGANIGYYCLHAISLGKTAIAIEPITRNLQYLMKNLRINEWEEKAEIFPVAIGESCNVVEIWGVGTGSSLIEGWAGTPSSYRSLVPTISLDRVLDNAIKGKKALILADIEGAELMMLKGAKVTLDNEPSPTWLIEVTTKENQPKGVEFNPNFAETFRVMIESGYRSYIVGDTLEEIDWNLIDEVSKSKSSLPHYNFLFRK